METSDTLTDSSISVDSVGRRSSLESSVPTDSEDETTIPKITITAVTDEEDGVKEEEVPKEETKDEEEMSVSVGEWARKEKDPETTSEAKENDVKAPATVESSDHKTAEDEEDYRPKPSAAKLAFLAKLAALETDIDADLAKNPPDEERKVLVNLTKEAARLDSAVDVAVELLKEGREMQKISVVRNLPELLNAHPDETQTRVLPLINESLTSASNSLDLHCETALVFRKVLGSPQLAEANPSLGPQLFAAIAANLASPETDNISGVAWIETLLDVVDQIPAESLKLEVVPIAVQQCQQAKSVQRRIAAIKLFHKILPRLAPQEVKATLVPCVQSLCQDPSPQVRNATAEKLLPPLAAPTNDSLSVATRAEYSSLVLPLLVELCSDDDPGVQETALDVLASCIPGFPSETLREVVVPLVQKCGEKAFQLDNSSLCVIAKNIGPWAFGLREVCSAEQRLWFLDFYRRLCRLGKDPDLGQSSDFGLALGATFESADPVHAACREWAAHNFPGLLVTEGVGNWETSSLQGIFSAFCTDPDEGVRRKIAQGFHAVAGLIEEFPADSASKERMRGRIQEAFMSLIRGGDLDVVSELTKHFADLLPVLYAGAVEWENGNPSMALSGIKMNRMLLAFNRLIRNSPNWRCQEAFLLGLAALRTVLPPRTLQQTFIPLLKEEVLTARALPCREAATRTLLLLARDAGSREQLEAVTEFFVETLCRHASCHKRALFVGLCRAFRALGPPELLKAVLLPPLTELLGDAVGSVRLAALAELVAVRPLLVLPADAGLLRSEEAAVAKLLSSADDRTRPTIQKLALRLSEAATSQAELPKTPPPPIKIPAPSLVAQTPPFVSLPSASVPTTSPHTPSTPSSPTSSSSSHSVPPILSSAAAVALATSASDSEAETALSRPLRLRPTTASACVEVQLAQRSQAGGTSWELRDDAVAAASAPTIRIIDALPPRQEARRVSNAPLLRIGKPRTAIVRPQPKMLISRSPSPRPETSGAKDPGPPAVRLGHQGPAESEEPKSAALKPVSDRLTRAQEPGSSPRRRVSTPQLRPVPKAAPPAAPAKAPPPRRGLVGASVRQMSSRWEPARDGNGNRPPPKPLVLPVAGKPMERKSTSTYMPSRISISARDRNNNPGRSGIPTPETSMLRRGSLQEESPRVRLIDNQGGPNPLRPSSSSSSIRAAGFGFGLMRVSSASAIHQKSSSILSMTTKSRRAEC